MQQQSLNNKNLNILTPCPGAFIDGKKSYAQHVKKNNQIKRHK